MHILAFIGGLVTLLAHIPLVIDIIRKKVSLNLATWSMWAIIDSLALAASIYAGAAAPFFVIAFTISAIVITLLLLRNKMWKWGGLESFAVAVSSVAIIVWAMAGAEVALICLVLGKYLAGIPTLRDAYNNPEMRQSTPWLLFGLGGFLNMIGQPAWTISNSLYPTVGFIFNAAVGLLHRKKRKGLLV